MAIIVVDNLPESIRSHELIDVMVEGVNAKAERVAPCLVGTDPEPSEGVRAEARLILIGAVRRWVEAGAGAFSQQSAGPFSVSTDTRQRTGFNLWPSEIASLQELCSSGSGGEAFTVDMTGGDVLGDDLSTRPDLWFQWVQPTPHGAP